MPDQPLVPPAGPVLGVDGCPGHWVIAEVAPDLPLEERTVRWHLLPVDPERLLSLPAAVVAIDVPIGLPPTGGRACDQAARDLLGGARSSVFFTPSRPVLEAPDYPAACALARSRGERAPSRQLWGIQPRIRAIDHRLQGAPPHDRERVVECHPELSFRLVAATPRMAAKRTAPGIGQRIAALTPFIDAAAALAEAPVEARVDDALDALVCAWTAARWLEGSARVLGGGLDAHGLPMRIVT